MRNTRDDREESVPAVDASGEATLASTLANELRDCGVLLLSRVRREQVAKRLAATGMTVEKLRKLFNHISTSPSVEDPAGVLGSLLKSKREWGSALEDLEAYEQAKANREKNRVLTPEDFGMSPEDPVAKSESLRRFVAEAVAVDRCSTRGWSLRAALDWIRAKEPEFTDEDVMDCIREYHPQFDPEAHGGMYGDGSREKTDG